jgi:hypothetical protein
MSLQKLTEYTPTNAESKLLEIMLNPELHGLNVTEICQYAGVSRQTYYDAFKKPEFVAYYQARAKDLVSAAVAPVVNAFIKAAKDGSYPHGKVILEMAGLYSERQKIEHMGANGGPIQVQQKVDLSLLTDKELTQLEHILTRASNAGADTSGKG